MRSNSFIFITTSFEGFHSYPEAPEEVSFLKDRHRHMFHVKIWIEVFHDNRDIEFILFKRYIDVLLMSSDLNDKSCEMICDHLAREIKAMYPNREIKIEVSEDNENGAYKEYEKESS